MKSTVVGATVPAKTLRAACAKADVPPKDVRVVGSRAWIELLPEREASPEGDNRDAALARLAEALGTGLMVIDADVSDAGVHASRATYRGVEEDVTDEARQLVESGGVPADASALAWALIGDTEAASPAQSNLEEQWAQALFDKLIADGTIELRDKRPSLAGLARILEMPGRDLGDRLLAELIDSTAIDEVFADADQLASAARATRPKR